MIIDFHTHTFPDKIAEAAVDKLKHAAHMESYRNGTENSLRESMREADIDISVVLPVATYPEQAIKINNSVIEKFSDGVNAGLLSLGAIHPHTEGAEAELERLKSAGIKGIKIHPLYQDTDLDDESYIRILKKCAELELLVVTHAGLDIGVPGEARATPQMSARAIEKVNSGSDPELKIVLAHMGGWFNWNETAKVLKGLPFFADTAFSFGDIEPIKGEEDVFIEKYRHMLKADELRDLIREYGTDRVVFGSDSPWAKQKKSVEFVKNCGLDEEELLQIFEENAVRLLGL